jgi:RNase H-like domain found in reverse transcriptase
MLMMPDHSRPFQIESDASKFASGVVLTQTDINGDRHPVAFLLKTFTDTECQYEIYDRELLGIVQALKKWRHYIQGSGHTTLVHTDHQNLTYFWKHKNYLINKPDGHCSYQNLISNYNTYQETK